MKAQDRLEKLREELQRAKSANALKIELSPHTYLARRPEKKALELASRILEAWEQSAMQPEIVRFIDSPSPETEILGKSTLPGNIYGFYSDNGLDGCH